MRKLTYYRKRAIEILDEINYLTLATVSKDGVPWNSPVAYSVDEDFKFYFGSPKNTQHSQNIRDNGKGFVVIYDSRAPDGEGEGVYMTAEIKELNDRSEVETAIKIMFTKEDDQINVDSFLNDAESRIYTVRPQKVWMNDADKKNGIYLDYRVEIELQR